MGNTVYTTRMKARQDPGAVTDQDDLVDEEEQAYDIDDAEFEQPATGLFSSPGRIAALVGALLMLIVVMAGVVMLATAGGPATNTANAVTAQISTVTNGNLGEQGSAPKNGSLAPDFEWVDASSNKTIRLSALRGKPVFLNFWATWCPPCRAEMPEMQNMYNKYKGKVEILGISLGPRDDPAGVKSFISQSNYAWNFIHDGSSTVGMRYQAYQIPMSYFIDKDGVIRATHIGAMSGTDMEKYLQQVGVTQGQ